MNTFPFKASHYAPPNPDYFQRHLSACFSWLNGTVWPCNTFVAPFFPPSTASRHCAQWDRGQRLHCRLCGHKKATILLGFMIIMSKIKTHLMPQKKKKNPSDFVLLQAPVNVKTRSRGIMMCRWVLFLFLWRLMSGTNAVRLQDDLNNIQTVHSSLQILWTPTFSSWHVWLASCDVDQNYFLILDIFFLPAWKVSMSVN